MKKNLKLFILILLTINSYSQTINGNQIVAEGNAKLKVQPDVANFNIKITKRNNVEKIAISELNIETGKLEKVFLKIGFTNKNIKISEYKVSKSDYGNQNEVTATNTISIDFYIDTKLIENFYQQIQNENLRDLNIEFTTKLSASLEKDQRKKLLKIAIGNAKENAINIADLLDIKLNNIKLVSKYNISNDFYSVRTIEEIKFKNVGVKDTKSDESTNPKTIFDKFEVEEIELEETITIVYEIVKK